MGAVWLYDLPDVCRNAGLVTHVYPGWETRSRSSGGYNAVYAVGIHHTASNTAPANDMNYMWGSHNPNEPVGAIYLARTGEVTIGAAGATNTQGKGVAWTNSKGQTTPTNDANRYWISIEAANAGTGEAWPVAQQEAYVVLCAALCDAYDLSDFDVRSHFEWAPGRKIDPFGPSRWAGHAMWDMGHFRSDVKNAMGGTLPPPPGGEEDMVPWRTRFLDTRPSEGGDGMPRAGENILLAIPSDMPACSAVWFNIQTLGGDAAGDQWGKLFTSPDAGKNTSEFMIDKGGGLRMGACYSHIGADRKFYVWLSSPAHIILETQAYRP